MSEEAPEPQGDQPPTSQVAQMRRQNLADSEIIQRLQDQGFSYQQISEAINQAEIQQGIGGGIPTTPRYTAQVERAPLEYSNDLPPTTEDAPRGMQASSLPSIRQQAPAANQYSQQPQQRMETTREIEIPTATYERGPEEQIEEIAEEIINEKWESLLEDVGDISAWKERTNTDISSIKQEILRVEHRFENLQKSILGKIGEYDEGISSVSIEIKALEKVFQKIIQPLTSNIKALEKVTKDLKER